MPPSLRWSHPRAFLRRAPSHAGAPVAADALPTALPPSLLCFRRLPALPTPPAPPRLRTPLSLAASAHVRVRSCVCVCACGCARCLHISQFIPHTPELSSPSPPAPVPAFTPSQSETHMRTRAPAPPRARRVPARSPLCSCLSLSCVPACACACLCVCLCVKAGRSPSSSHRHHHLLFTVFLFFSCAVRPLLPCQTLPLARRGGARLTDASPTPTIALITLTLPCFPAPSELSPFFVLDFTTISQCFFINTIIIIIVSLFVFLLNVLLCV